MAFKIYSSLSGNLKKAIFALMTLKKPFIVLFVMVLATGYTHAQVRKSVKSAKFRVPTVSRSKMRIMCPIFETSAYPYQGIGVKMGDPLKSTRRNEHRVAKGYASAPANRTCSISSNVRRPLVWRSVLKSERP